MKNDDEKNFHEQDEQSLVGNNVIDETNPSDLAFSMPIVKENKKGHNKAFGMFKSFVTTVKSGSINMEVVNFKSKLVKFSLFITSKSFRVKIFTIVLASFILGFLTLLLVKNSGLYSLGINGIFQGIAKLSKTSLELSNASQQKVDLLYNLLFWGLNIVFNIPLAYFAYKKVSKQFAYLTIITIICSQLFGLALNYIPYINEIYIFGNTKWDLTSLNDDPIIKNALSDISFSKWGDANTLSLLVYCIINGLLNGLTSSFILMVGSSTGGTDIFSMYYAKKKNKPIGMMILFFNNACLFTSTIIGTFGSLCMADIKIVTNYVDTNNNASSVIQSILSPNYIFSATMSIISGMIIDLIFPKSKFVQIKVYTNDANKLKQNLLLVGYSHDMYINEISNAVTFEKQYTLETICMYIELTNVLNTIRLVDNTSLISINKLEDIDGNMSVIK